MKKLAGKFLTAGLLLLCCTVSALAMPKQLIPGGNTIGIKLFTKGLVVTGFDSVSAAKNAGIKKGDVIIEVDGEKVHTTEALRQCLAQETVVVTVLRNGREAEFCVRPRENQLGAYVRDSISGIGTVTYYDPETGTFGALGHGVNEAGGSSLLPMEAGVTVAAEVEQIRKGRTGTPGELKGSFDVNRIMGEVERNCRQGLFGTMVAPIAGPPMALALRGEVETGKAEIWSNVAGTQVEPYAVEILKIYPHADDTGRNLLIQVTDPALLRQTGGIVQGMSGSPIIQDGKLVGAVTHVLVNDPTRGYGIFIENMLDAAENTK